MPPISGPVPEGIGPFFSLATHRHMPGLTYPFVYECSNCECSNCDRETTVTRPDARGLYPDPDTFNAVEVVLRERGWMWGEIEEMVFCRTV